MAEFTFETWRAGIIPLTVQGSYENPFLECRIEALFTGPSGQTIAREAYWDGEDRFKISFAPTEAGEWHYTVKAPEESGVNGLSGTVKAVLYEGDLPIYQHGFLRVADDGYRIVYQDGTPFFWLGDTHWAFVAGERWDWSNHPNMTSMFKGMVDKRKSQKFTVYQTNTRASYKKIDPNSPFARMSRTHYWEDGKEGYLPDVRFYQEVVDPRMQYIADAGLVNAIGLDWANGIVDLMEQHVNMVHYFIARYGALPLVHTIAGEAAGYAGGELRERTIAGWREIGKEIRRTDGYHQLITAHYNTARPFEDYYFDEDWFDFTLNQAGHGDFPLTPGDFTEYRKTHVGKPFVEGESLYEGCSTLEPIGSRYCTADMMRRIAYITMQVGASGYTYGAQGIWDTLYEKPEGPPENSMMNIFNQYNVTWYEAIDLPGADQLTLMRDFYEAADFHTLRPSEDLIRQEGMFGNPMIAGLRTPLSMADPERKTVVLYYMAAARGQAVLQGLLKPAYRAEWFDPRTGDYTSLGTVRPENGEWRTPAKPDGSDWVLKLTAL